MAWNDERGYASEIRPGLGLHDLFGARENEVRMRDDIRFSWTDEHHPAIDGLEKSDVLKGSLYSQTLKTINDKTKILATDSEKNPTLTSQPYGKGEAMLAGTYMGMANFPEVDPVNDQFFKIGRASCRERESDSERGVAVKGKRRA